MMTVNEVSKLTGVSIRTLQYYDAIGLLHPAAHSEAGYRLYDDASLETLQQILLYRELRFPLRDIAGIMNSPVFDRRKALMQQIRLLEMQRDHLDNLIAFARGMTKTGDGGNMDFTAFDTEKIEAYAAQAKSVWGNTPEYREYEEKAKNRSSGETAAISTQMMDIFAELGKLTGMDPGAKAVQDVIRKLQAFISEHFYTCSKSILSSLGQAYAGPGEMQENIDRYAGPGTGMFASRAIQIYCAE